MNISEPWISHRNDLWKSRNPRRAHLRQITSPTGATRGNTRPLSVLVLLTFYAGLIGLICHLQQKELGHGAADNPIYRFAIYYKFLWLLGPLSHRFVDCLLSWVLMSCCLNHCIITALIHFLAYPHTRSAGSPLLEENGLKHGSESRQLVTSSLRWGVILGILPFHEWRPSCHVASPRIRRYRWQEAHRHIICI